MWRFITGVIAGVASSGLGTVAFSGSKLAIVGLQIAGNALISGGITAGQGLITRTFSWTDVGISSVFGSIGGGVGLKYSGASLIIAGVTPWNV